MSAQFPRHVENVTGNQSLSDGTIQEFNGKQVHFSDDKSVRLITSINWRQVNEDDGKYAVRDKRFKLFNREGLFGRIDKPEAPRRVHRFQCARSIECAIT